MFILIIKILIIIILLFFIYLYMTSPYMTSRIKKVDLEYYVRGEKYYLDKNAMNRYIPFLVREEVRTEMLDLLEKVHNTLKKNNIDYWLYAGTLLGYYRHGTLIPWDDDIDIGMDISQMSKIEEMANRKEIYIHKTSGIWKVNFSETSWFPFVDIFFFKNRNDLLTLCMPLDKNGECTYGITKVWPDEMVEPDVIYPTQEVTMSGIKVNIPNKTKEYIIQTYNEKALTEYWMKGWFKREFPYFFNHKTDSYIRKYLFG